MVAAIKQVVTVGPGGVIEVRSPLLTPGAQAEVIVLMQDEASRSATPARPLSSFIGAGRGGFQDSAEVDAAIRQLRDWDQRDR